MRAAQGAIRRGRRAKSRYLMTGRCVVSRLGEWVEDDEGFEHRKETPVYDGPYYIQEYNPQTRAAVSVGAPKNIFVCSLHVPIGADVRDGDVARLDEWPRPLTLHGSSPKTWITDIRMEAWDEANSDA